MKRFESNWIEIVKRARIPEQLYAIFAIVSCLHELFKVRLEYSRVRVCYVPKFMQTNIFALIIMKIDKFLSIWVLSNKNRLYYLYIAQDLCFLCCAATFWSGQPYPF